MGLEGIHWAARHFPVRSVIYVPDKHELHDHEIDSIAELEAAAPEKIM